MKNESIRTEHKGCVEWRNKEGQLHRTDGPAIKWADGTESWYLNGVRYYRADWLLFEFDAQMFRLKTWARRLLKVFKGV